MNIKRYNKIIIHKMPNCTTHSNLTEIFLKETNISEEERNQFRIWWLIPDLRLDELTRDKTHYYSGSCFLKKDFISTFLKDESLYKKDWDINFLILWYLFHLFIDNAFIDKRDINEIYINENIWRFSRIINEVLDIKENTKIIIRLEDISEWEIQIKKEDLPTIFKNIDKDLINSEFSKQIKFIIEKTKKTQADLLPKIKKTPQINVHREQHKESIQKALSSFIEFIKGKYIYILNKNN